MRSHLDKVKFITFLGFLVQWNGKSGKAIGTFPGYLVSAGHAAGRGDRRRFACL